MREEPTGPMSVENKWSQMDDSAIYSSNWTWNV